jgi:hypothetical protein
MRVRNTADMHKGLVEPDMCRRVGRRTKFSFDDPAVQIDNDHI